MIHLWYHENMRVYHDRLVSKEDKDMFIAESIKIGNSFAAIGKSAAAAAAIAHPDAEAKK